MLNLFLDTEFTELTRNAELISMALVAETGEYFYAENSDINPYIQTEWVEKNVIRQLSIKQNLLSDVKAMEIKGNSIEIATAFKIWLAQFPVVRDDDKKIIPNITVWADNYTWDWLLFTDLFGGSFSLPELITYIPMDIATLLKIKNIDPDIDREELLEKKLDNNYSKHHALYDAILISLIHKKLIKNG